MSLWAAAFTALFLMHVTYQHEKKKTHQYKKNYKNLTIKKKIPPLFKNKNKMNWSGLIEIIETVLLIGVSVAWIPV